jgi:hypothetical protein
MTPIAPYLKNTCRSGVTTLFETCKRPEDVDYVMGRIDGVCSCFQLTSEERAYVNEVNKHLSDMKYERVRKY